MDCATALTGFMKIKLGFVKPSEIINDTHHKLQRIMCLEVQALVTLHGIACRVSLGKGVSGKTFDLIPYPLRYRFGVSFISAIFKKPVADFFEFFTRPELSGHAPPQHIGFRQAEFRKMVCYFNYVL